MPTLQFKGKSFVQNHHLSVKYHQLIPNKEKSLTNQVSLHDNLIVHGDNLKALKALLPTYAGKINCSFLDVPYNTGNEKWVYNDNVNGPMIKEWIGSVVDKDDLSRHDKWLAMMMPRIKLVKELLAPDGFVFICIDDNEYHHLRMLMNEVFGEHNYIATFVWQKNAGGQNDGTHVAFSHEYVVAYSKDFDKCKLNRLPLPEETMKNYKYSDEHEQIRGKYQLRNLNDFSIGDRPGLHYDIECPDGTILKGSEHRWRCDWNKFKWRLENDRIVFKKDENGWKVFYKVYLNEEKEKLITDSFGNPIPRGKIPSTWVEELPLSSKGGDEIKEIFGKRDVFAYPKPTALVKHFIKIGSDKNGIILDSFAGSGTTGQAILELNKEDGGNRRFILIEMENYADEITAERIRRVIKGVPNSKDSKLKEGLGGTFSYFTLGDPIELEAILHGTKLPPYEDLARYVFFTATGEEFDPKKIDIARNFIGESKDFEVYLFYRPDMQYLKTTSLNMDTAQSLGDYKGKKRLVFAPMKYLDEEYLHVYHIEFSQLPFEIYRMKD